MSKYCIFFSIEQNPEGENPSLWRVLFMTYRKRLFYAGLWKLFGDVLNVVGPVVILPIVNYVRQIQEGTLVLRGEFHNKIYYVGWMEFIENGWTLAFLAFVASILQSNFSQESARIGANEGIRAKTALQAKLFDKTLKMSVSGAKYNEASEDFADCADAGNALNYVLKDTENIMMLFMHCHYIWAIPLKV
ncbi:ATP-binding cassette sub-family C member 8, partial [Armadillidium nasatum]